MLSYSGVMGDHVQTFRHYGKPCLDLQRLWETIFILSGVMGDQQNKLCILEFHLIIKPIL